jgi:hypothetical protein
VYQLPGVGAAVGVGQDEGGGGRVFRAVVLVGEWRRRSRGQTTLSVALHPRRLCFPPAAPAAPPLVGERARRHHAQQVEGVLPLPRLPPPYGLHQQGRGLGLGGLPLPPLLLLPHLGRGGGRDQAAPGSPPPASIVPPGAGDKRRGGQRREGAAGGDEGRVEEGRPRAVDAGGYEGRVYEVIGGAVGAPAKVAGGGGRAAARIIAANLSSASMRSGNGVM